MFAQRPLEAETSTTTIPRVGVYAVLTGEVGVKLLNLGI
jgi:hypothetical protein